MKKLGMTLLATLAGSAAFALPVGNPSEASLLHCGLVWNHCDNNCAPNCDPCAPCGFDWCNAFSFRAGFYGDYVFNRFLRNRNNNTGNNRAQLEHSEINTNAGYLALNLCDRLDVFATLGTTNLYLNGNLSTFFPALVVFPPPVSTGDGQRISIETRNDFSWSVGARATLWECGCTALGLEGQYFSTDPRVSRVTIADEFSSYPAATSPYLSTHYYEWQVGLGLSQRINILVPYVAVKWSGSKLTWKGAPDNRIFVVLPDAAFTLNNMRNAKHWGFATGVSLVGCDRVLLTAEGRFGDERAFYVNGQVRF